jgi:hypothetical protein
MAAYLIAQCSIIDFLGAGRKKIDGLFLTATHIDAEIDSARNSGISLAIRSWGEKAEF